MADRFAPYLLDLGNCLYEVGLSALEPISIVVGAMKGQALECAKEWELVGHKTHFIDSGLIGFNVVDTNVEAIFSETNGYRLASVTSSVSQASTPGRVFDRRTYMPREEPVTIAVRFPWSFCGLAMITAVCTEFNFEIGCNARVLKVERASEKGPCLLLRPPWEQEQWTRGMLCGALPHAHNVTCAPDCFQPITPHFVDEGHVRHWRRRTLSLSFSSPANPVRHSLLLLFEHQEAAFLTSMPPIEICNGSKTMFVLLDVNSACGLLTSPYLAYL